MTDTDAKHKREFPPRWLMLLMVCLIVGGGLVGMSLQSKAIEDAKTARANTEVLQDGILRTCAISGTFRFNDRDLCEKAKQVQLDPTQPLPGPKGEPGKDGVNGKDGIGTAGPAGPRGPNGEDSTIPGPQGPPGSNGLPGAASIVPGPTGLQGSPGENSTVPGPAGPPGPAGKDGANGNPGTNGTSPTSFTFTDAVGHTYNCTPDPPGSSTYTCTTPQAP